MNTFEILRFTNPYVSTNDYVLKTDEEENSQHMYLEEQEKDYFSQESCCGQYVIKYKTAKIYPDEEMRDLLKSLLANRTLDRTLGDLNRLNATNKNIIATIMDEIKAGI